MFRTTRIIAKAVTALAAIAGTLVLAAPHADAAGWTYADANGDGRSDTAGIDNDGNGTWDVIWHDADANNTWDIGFTFSGAWTQVRFANQSGIIWVYRTSTAYWAYEDAQGDGRYERLWYGAIGQAPSWAQLDNNGDGTFDEGWFAYSPSGATPQAVASSPQGSALRNYFNWMNLSSTHRMNMRWLNSVPGDWRWWLGA